MKKFLPIILTLLFIFASFFAYVKINHAADPIDELTQQIKDLTSKLDMSVNATRPLESQLNSMQKQISSIKYQVILIDADVAQKKKYIDSSYKNLAVKQDIMNRAIRDFYIKSSYNSPLLIFLSAKSASDITQLLAYQKAAENQDKVIITNIALSIVDLEQKKKDLESEVSRLTALKSNLDDQSAKLDKIVQGAKAYQTTLSNQIADLSAKQQALLAQKYASLGISISAYNMSGGCKSDLLTNTDPGFSPKIGFFTYGVPNRIGLNQFGAKGRADAGQSAETILSAYYNADLNKGYDTGINIHVTGSNEYGQSFDTNWNIEDYVKHIYEMPTDWSMEALKAQAVAARSYALATTNNGSNSICPSQQCQVVKQEINSDRWQQAVDATKGWVLTSGGSPIKAWFSSTHGGYVFTSSDIGWSGTSYTKRLQDTTSNVSNFSDLQNNAYDKSSPWFYCDWGSRGGTAWLRPSEVADIVNVVALAQADSSTKEHLYQQDKSNPAGTDTWSSDRVRQELQNRNITPFNSVSNLSVSVDFGVGRVTSINISGDGGSANFPGDFFKTYFNIRAPANIQIVGPLYNIEQR